MNDSYGESFLIVIVKDFVKTSKLFFFILIFDVNYWSIFHLYFNIYQE